MSIAQAGQPYRARLLTVRGTGEGEAGRRSRALTSVGRTVGATPTAGSRLHFPATVRAAATEQVRRRVTALGKRLGRPLKILIGKPGLDGHSNGAEQIAVRARDAGMEVVYDGIRLTPGEIVRSAGDEGVHVIGLSILSGSHLGLVGDVMERLGKEGLGDVPVVVGGIIPPADAKALRALGVAAVYTPKDFQLNDIMADIVRLVEGRAEAG